MAGRRELALPRPSRGSLKEQLVRTTLRNVRLQGHTYVELREDGKKLIFLCMLCRTECYGDANLYNHLNGNRHAEMLATAKATLLKPKPWPFNDGLVFFHDDSEEKSKSLPVSDSERIKLLDTYHDDADSLAIVSYGSSLKTEARVSPDVEDHGDCDEVLCDSNLDGDGAVSELVIPGVLQKEEVSDLPVRHMGVGLIGARFSEKDGASNEIRRIWCEWLGSEDFANEGMNEVPEHDFGVVVFAYNCSLGRRGLLDDFKSLLPSSPHSEAEDTASSFKKRKSFSDPEDVSCVEDSSGEESQLSNNSNSNMVLAGNDDQQVLSRILSSKSMRKKLRDHQRLASDRQCDICQQKLLPDKDVAALLNRNTGKLVCSSRNLTGAFHVFHISCLLHWILLCEVEIYEKQSVEPKVKRRSRKRTKGKNGDKSENQEKQIRAAFCPQCQGTGISTNGEDLEKPTVSLSEIFRCKIKLLDAYKAWMKSPELLENCSMGFTFPVQSDETYQENVSPLKLLHFYRASGSTVHEMEN